MREQTQSSIAFDSPSYNVTRDLKEVMRAVVGESRLSREEIVDRMNGLAERYGVCLIKGNGRGLTLDTFEKWINPGDTSRQIPVKALPIFNRVLGSVATLDVLARPMGARVIGSDEADLLEWAELHERRKKDAKVMKRIEERRKERNSRQQGTLWREQ